MIKEITDKQELKDYEIWKHQLKLVGGHRETNMIVNVYTNYINQFAYIYDNDYNLVKVIKE